MLFAALADITKSLASRTAKVWKDFQLAYTIEGHEQSVWAVLALEGEDDLVLTGESRSISSSSLRICP